MKSTTLTALLVLTVSGCATNFVGSAYVENGASGCESKCSGQGLEFVGMVYMGEYSDACVCAVPGQTASARQQLLAANATSGGAAGVVMQQRRQSQEQQTSNP